MAQNKVFLLELNQCPIFKQLQIEESLLRTDQSNWCVINHGAPPAIVFGLSGKPADFIDLNQITKTPIPLVKRYSGGGTVVVDQDTLFISFIFQKELIPKPCYPESILRWSEEFYRLVFPINTFELKEHDYAIGNRKCGGNAQYLQKTRFVHHTTWLWDFQKTYMDLLLLPAKTPKYRQGRSHELFLCRLKDYLSSKQHFLDQVKQLLSRLYQIEQKTEKDILPFLDKDHRKTTSLFKL